MPELWIHNTTAEPIYVFQYVKWQYKIIDYLIDAAEFAAGVGELKEALVAVEELPVVIETIEDVFKYFSTLQKIYKKTVEVKEDAEGIADNVFKYFEKNSILVPKGEKIDILNQKSLSNYISGVGLEELLGAKVITVSLMGKQGELGLQFQSAVDQTWNVFQGGVEKDDNSVVYLWHGEGEHQQQKVNWRPGMAVYSHQLYVVGRGEKNAVWWSAYNGNSWSYPIHIEGIRTVEGVSLVEFGKYLYAGWIGPENNHLQISRFDGSNWAHVTTIPNAGSSNTPSLAVAEEAASPAGNPLVATWRGTDGKIWTSSSEDGVSWKPQEVIKDIGTSNAPVSCGIKLNIVSAWKGFGSDTRIWFKDGFMTEQATIPGAATSSSPALVSVPNIAGNIVFCVWKGPGLDNRMFMSAAASFYTAPLTTWTPLKPPYITVPAAYSSDGPAIACYENQLFIVWNSPTLIHTANWLSIATENWLSDTIDRTWTQIGIVG